MCAQLLVLSVVSNGSQLSNTLPLATKCCLYPNYAVGVFV